MERWEILMTIGMVVITVLAMCNFLAKSMFQQKRTTPPHSMINPFSFAIITTFGLLALSSTFGGILAIILNAQGESELYLLGAKLSTGYMGPVFVSSGLLIAWFTVKTVLNNAKEFATLFSSEDYDQ